MSEIVSEFYEPALFKAALARAHAVHGKKLDAIQKASEDQFKRLDSQLQTVAKRDAPYFGPTELSVITKTIEEKVNVPSGLALLPLYRGVPAGARSFKIRQTYGVGEATIYRGGQKIPVTEIGADEIEYKVKYIVNAHNIDVLGNITNNLVGFDEDGAKRRYDRRAIELRINKLIFQGSPMNQLWGIINHPYIPKRVSTVNFSSSGTPALQIKALFEYSAWSTMNGDSGTGGPNTLALATRIYNNLFLPRADTSEASVLKYFLTNNGRIVKVVPVYELQGVGPGGLDGMFFFRDDSSSIGVVIPQPFTSLPVQSHDFVNTVYNFASYGGVVVEYAGDNLLVWAQGV